MLHLECYVPSSCTCCRSSIDIPLCIYVTRLPSFKLKKGVKIDPITPIGKLTHRIHRTHQLTRPYLRPIFADLRTKISEQLTCHRTSKFASTILVPQIHNKNMLSYVSRKNVFIYAILKLWLKIKAWNGN